MRVSALRVAIPSAHYNESILRHRCAPPSLYLSIEKTMHHSSQTAPPQTVPRHSGSQAATYPNGRKARVFDIVHGVTDVGIYSKIPFVAQVVQVLPNAGKAEIAFIRRPASMSRRLPHMALQNVAASILERDLVPLAKLKLRSRASRPVAPYLKAAAGNATPG